uniref:DNA 5'-3' helicase n=1 Tax=uncultured marine virus TaxID=186617 RepID=A0A0F7L6J1_9VIRU|nr:replicative DNA helicase [uncultured marine virus]
MDLINELGKLPPQAIELEEAVLGAMLLDGKCIDDIADIIKAEHFYKSHHQIIAKHVLDMYTNNETIDILTVSEKLKTKEVLDEIGGYFYISQLTSKISSTAHVDIHAKKVVQKYLARELIRVSQTINQRAYDQSEDVDELLSFAETSILKVNDDGIGNEPKQIKDTINETYLHLKDAKEKHANHEMIGVDTGFRKLNDMTGGWQSPDLIILAARPSMGKTSLALEFAKVAKVPTALFCLEMSTNQLNTKYISGETDYTNMELKTGSFDDLGAVARATTKLKDLPIFIDDTPSLDLIELSAKCRRLKKKQGIGLIIIDYLQLMTCKAVKGNREQEIASISRGLKKLAKSLEVPIIALSQLNRSVESRSGDKEPQLSDLRESGAIEQDADTVMFLHRPYYYGINEVEIDHEQINSEFIAMLLIRKHRGGALGGVALEFNKGMSKWKQYEAKGSFMSEVESEPDKFLEPNKDFGKVF